MDDLLVREKLRTYVVEHEPPLRLTSAGLLRQGFRRRMIRLGALSTVALTAVAFAGLYLSSSEPRPVLSAEAACLARVPIVPNASPDITADPLASTSPWTPASPDDAERVSCHLVDTLLAMLPDQRYLPATWRGAAPFQTVQTEQGLTASARTAGGSFAVIINRPEQAWEPAASPSVVLHPQPGVTVTVTHDNPISPSSRVTIVVVRTPGTVIIVSADNLRAIRPEPVAFGEPVLTDDQLTQIASAPQLALYG